MEKKTLLDFIANAHRHTYAAPKEVRKQHRCEVPILEGHKDYEFVEGDLSYHDSYAGSQWAPGREVVFFQGNPIWCMAYQGQHNLKYWEKTDCSSQRQAGRSYWICSGPVAEVDRLS